MSYTLAAAASATGLSKAIILRAIKDGRITATKDERGEWRIEPAELSALAPSVAGPGAGEPSAVPDVEALGEQIEALLRQAGDRLRQQLAEVRREHDGEGLPDPELVLVDRHE
jgi:excisionase family DNA binding protein